MKDKFNQILISYRPQLVDEIDCSELLNILISKNVLTRRQVKSIEVSLVCVEQEFKLCELQTFAKTFYHRPQVLFLVITALLIVLDFLFYKVEMK